jgi:hypothetical protein
MPTGPRAGRNLQKRRGVVRELGMKKSLPPPSLLVAANVTIHPKYPLRCMLCERSRSDVGNRKSETSEHIEKLASSGGGLVTRLTWLERNSKGTERGHSPKVVQRETRATGSPEGVLREITPRSSSRQGTRVQQKLSTRLPPD